jgi:hypothetical protein
MLAIPIAAVMLFLIVVVLLQEAGRWAILWVKWGVQNSAGAVHRATRVLESKGSPTLTPPNSN